MKAESRFNKKQKSNTKSEQNTNSKKIIINTKEDLNKISFSDLKNAKIYDFSGDFFNFIYEKALNIEKNPAEKEALMTFNDTENDNNLNEKNDKGKQKIKNNNNNKKKKKKDKEENDDNYNDNNNKYINNKKNENNNIKPYNFNENMSTINTKPTPVSIKKEFKIKKIIFQMKYNTQPGEDLGVIGSISELGSWEQNNALRMRWNDGNIWKAEINYDFGMVKEFEFKFIFIENGRVKKWEDGNNRKLNFYELKNMIEPMIKDEYKVEFKNIKGNDIIYSHNENTIMIISDWNRK
jgi:hypothetical protein